MDIIHTNGMFIQITSGINGFLFPCWDTEGCD